MLLSTTTIIQSEMNDVEEPEKPIPQINLLDKGMKPIPVPNDKESKDSVDDPVLRNQLLEGDGDHKNEKSDVEINVPDHRVQGKGHDDLAHKPLNGKIPVNSNLREDGAPKKGNDNQVDSESKELDRGPPKMAIDVPPKVPEGLRMGDKSNIGIGEQERGDKREVENPDVPAVNKEKVEKGNQMDLPAENIKIPQKNAIRDQEEGNAQPVIPDQQPAGNANNKVARSVPKAEPITVPSSVLDGKKPKKAHDKLQSDVSKLNERLDKLEKENKNLKQRQEAIEGIQVENFLGQDEIGIDIRDSQNIGNKPANLGLQSNVDQVKVNIGPKRNILEAKKDDGVLISNRDKGDLEHDRDANGGGDDVLLVSEGKAAAVATSGTVLLQSSHIQTLDNVTKIIHEQPKPKSKETSHKLIGTSKLSSTDGTFNDNRAQDGKRDLKSLSSLQSHHNPDNS